MRLCITHYISEIQNITETLVTHSFSGFFFFFFFEILWKIMIFRIMTKIFWLKIAIFAKTHSAIFQLMSAEMWISLWKLFECGHIYMIGTSPNFFLGYQRIISVYEVKRCWSINDVLIRTLHVNGLKMKPMTNSYWIWKLNLSVIAVRRRTHW